MATVVEVIEAKYVLDASGYKKGAKEVEDASKKASKAASDGSKDGKSSKVGPSFKGLATDAFGIIKEVGQAVAAVLAVEFAVIGNSMKKAAEFESLVSSIEAVEGSAEKARRSLSRLRDIAKAPGLGVKEATTGYLGLRRAGLGTEFSMRAVAGAGKANALSGGGKENLDRVLLAMSQIANKANLSAEELLQLTEAGVNANQALKEAFGTADTEKLKKMGVTSKDALEAIVAGFERLPAKAGGTQNAFDNLADAIDFTQIAIGGAFNKAFLENINNFGNTIGELESSGFFTTFGELLSNTFSSFTDGFGGFKEMIVNVAAIILVANERLTNFIKGIVGVAKAIYDFLVNIPGFKYLMKYNPVEMLYSGGEGMEDQFKRIKATLMASDEAGKKRAEKQAKADAIINEKEAREEQIKATKLQAQEMAKAQEEQNKANRKKLSEIADHTRRTAENTKPEVNISDRILGGGTLAGRGISKQELTDISSAPSRSKDIKQALVELGVAIEREISRTANVTVGRNVSRREV
jgi:tape measure domain-containing protein